MNVEIWTDAAKFLFWEHINGFFVLQCGVIDVWQTFWYDTKASTERRKTKSFEREVLVVNVLVGWGGVGGGGGKGTQNHDRKRVGLI